MAVRYGWSACPFWKNKIWPPRVVKKKVVCPIYKSNCVNHCFLDRWITFQDCMCQTAFLNVVLMCFQDLETSSDYILFFYFLALFMIVWAVNRLLYALRKLEELGNAVLLILQIFERELSFEKLSERWARNECDWKILGVRSHVSFAHCPLD